MIAVRTYDAEVDARVRQITASESAANLSWVRYDGGKDSYLEFLDLQRSLFNSELKGSETLQQELTSIVRLYQALGGGWLQPEVEEADEPATSEEEVPPDALP
jgi:outer membrane protein, multidrug efflux system